MILSNRSIRCFLIPIKRLEIANSSTMHIPRQERHSRMRLQRKFSKLHNKFISLCLVALRRPMIILLHNRESIKRHQDELLLSGSGGLTRSSSNSASALNLLTNPPTFVDPRLPIATRGFNFDSSKASMKFIRG